MPWVPQIAIKLTRITQHATVVIPLHFDIVSAILYVINVLLIKILYFIIKSMLFIKSF